MRTKTSLTFQNQIKILRAKTIDRPLELLHKTSKPRVVERTPDEYPLVIRKAVMTINVSIKMYPSF